MRLGFGVDSDSRPTPGWVDRVLSAIAESESKAKDVSEPAMAHKRPLAALSGPVLNYDLTPRQRRLVHVFTLTAWITCAINRY